MTQPARAHKLVLTALTLALAALTLSVHGAPDISCELEAWGCAGAPAVAEARVSELSDVTAFVAHAMATRTVPVIQWAANDRWSAPMAAARELAIPVVMRGTDVSKWPAVGRVDPSFFCARGDVFAHAACLPLSAPVARYYLPDRPMASLRELNETLERDFLASRIQRDGLSACAFFAESAARAPECGVAYVSAMPDELTSDGALRALMGPTRVLSDGLLGDGEAEPPLRMWLGSARAVAQLHYDMSHNAFAHLSGAKRFFLLEPELAPRVQLYPSLHPGARLSQLDFGVDAERSVNASGALPPPFVVDLEPGDLLYLPPFWFHRVTALTACVSANIWAPLAEVNALLAFARRVAAPAAVGDLRVFVSLAVDVADVHESARTIAAEIAARYRALFTDAELESARESAVDWSACVPSAEVLPARLARDAQVTQLVGEAFAREFGPHVLAVQPTAVRRVVLADFLETVLHRALPNPIAVGAFFNTCFLP